MYKTILFEISNYEEINTMVPGLLNSLVDDGNIFLFVRNKVNKEGILKFNFLNVVEKVCQLDGKYVNIIICPSKERRINNLLKTKYFSIIWLAKNYSKMYFNKDAIREKHIWKDVEWGGREKNYNKNGKDPGNVWLQTEDNGKGKITKHIVLDLKRIIDRIILSTTKPNEEVLIDISGVKNLTIESNDRKIIINSKRDTPSFEFNYSLNNNLPQNVFWGGKVIFDTCETMQKIDNNSVTLIVTSPPYWNLKNYFKEAQIGKEDYNTYLNRLRTVWQESYRILSNAGSMWININIRTKSRNPILIPSEIINQCTEIGFKLRDIIIWHKSSGIPTRSKNLVDRHEYFLWFTKTNKFKFVEENIENIRDYKNETINCGNIWNINRKAGSIAENFIHPAIYPIKLVDRVIELCTVKGDLIVDPFLGSGTSMLSALAKERNFIGYEYNEQFYELIKYRAKRQNIKESLIEYIFLNNIKEKKIGIFRKL